MSVYQYIIDDTDELLAEYVTDDESRMMNS